MAIVLCFAIVLSTTSFSVFAEETTVATVNGVAYPDLQSAIDDAYTYDGNVTITLNASFTGNVKITEKAGLYLTLDGNGKTFNGKITIAALSDTNDNRRTTIKNVNFVTNDEDVDFITSNETNHYPRLTVQDCSFTGTGNADTVAIRTKSAYGLVVEDCTGTGLHSFLQNTSGVGVSISSVKVTDSKGGLALGTAQNVSVSNCDITTKGYGIRLDAVLDTDAVLENNTVNAYIPVVVRKATATDYDLTFTGDNNAYTASNTDGKWCVIGTEEYEEGIDLPTTPVVGVDVTCAEALTDGLCGYTSLNGKVVVIPEGSVTPCYTGAGSFWGEASSNAVESLVIKLYEGDNQIASASLNNIGGIIDGDVFVTWNIPFAPNNDGYWNVEWAEGYPKYDMNPTAVKLFSDGVEVSTNNVRFNGPDDLNKIVAVAEDADGNVNAYTNLADAVNTAKKVIVVRDTTLSEILTLPADITFNGNGKYINGEVWADGNVIFVGYTKVAKFNAGYNRPVITIGEGSTLETTTGRMVIGHGATFNITGTIENAKTATVARAIVEPSLIAPGASFTGAGVNFNVSNAYIKFTDYCSSKNTSASGTHNFNITNSVWDQTKSFVFTEPTGGMDPTFNLNVKDSVMNTTSHLVFAVTKGEIVIDNSIVNEGNYRQLENRSNLTIKNGSVVYAAVATSQNAKNPGTTIVDNATYITTGEFTGSDLGTGTLIVKNGATFTTDKVSKANVTVDATSNFTATTIDEETTNVTVKGSTLTGTGTQEDPYVIADLMDLKFFRDSVNNGNNYKAKYVKLTADIDLAQEEWVPIGNNSKKFEGYFDGNNKTISNITVSGNNKYAGLFGYIKGTGMTENSIPTVQNLTLDNVSVSGDYFVGGLSGQGYTCKVANVTVKGNVNGTRYVGGLIGHVYTYFDNCHFIGDVTGSFDAIGGIAGAGDGRIYNSSVIGDVTGCNWVGGIIANGQEGTSVVGCYVKGTVSTSSNWYFGVGGIAGVGGHGYNGSVIKDNYFDGEVYLCGEKVNAIVVGLVNAESNDTIGTIVDGNSWNTEYYSAETPVVVTAEVEKSNASPEEWAASASEEKSSVRNNNLVMLESDLQYVDAQDINDVTKMTFSTVDDAAIQAVVELNAPIEVGTKEELNVAIAAAKEGQTILLTADIDYGTDQLKIEKAIILDLDGKTLTTRNAWGGMSLNNGPSIKNGTIVHASNTAAIKVWNATAFEDLVIDVQGKGDDNKTIGGIVVQSGSTSRVGTIMNVTIKGAALTNGIETYNCGDAAEDVIGSMENVTIDALATGMLISAPCGTATNCNIKGGTNGIEIWIKGTYSASLDLVDSVVDGGVYAHDEFNSNPNIQNNGTLELTVDEDTTGAGEDDITLTIARAENIEGVLETVLDNSKVKVGDTYYQTLQKAFEMAKDGSTITILDDMTLVDTTYTIAAGVAVTLDLNGKKITVTENKTNNFELFYNLGELTVTGNGSIELTAIVDRDWNAMSTIFHNRGGVLTIENGTFTHKGGTDMAYVVDNSANYAPDATTNIKGGSLSSTYIAIRNRMDKNKDLGGASGTPILNVSGGSIYGYKRGIWGQASSAPCKGDITITDGTVTSVEQDAVVVATADGSDIRTAISGGIFSSDVSAFLVDGASISKNNDGTYGVVAERIIEVSASEEEVVAGQELTVTVKLAKGENIYNAEWKLSYDTSLFELKGAAAQTGFIKEISSKTLEGEIFAEGEVLNTYTFVAKAVPAEITGSFTLSETTASTFAESRDAVQVAATNNDKADVTIIMIEYDVTATLNGKNVDLTIANPAAETTYTGEAQDFIVSTNLPANVAYEITYTVNGEDAYEVALTDVGTYEVVYTITTADGYAEKTGTVKITVKEPEFVVETTKWTNMGKKLVLVYTNQDAMYFTYDGKLMIDVTSKGYLFENTTEYAHVFAFVTDELENDVVDSYKEKVMYISEAEGLFILTDGHSKADINFSNTLNVQDISVEFGIVNLHSEIYGDVKYQKHLLKGDTNGDKIVNGKDTAFVVSEVKTAMGIN